MNMREFNEKRIYKTIEIPTENIKKMKEICEEKNISINEFINIAIKNNFKSSMNKIEIYKKSEVEPIKVRIYESIHKQLSSFTSVYDISIVKLINHFIYKELDKYVSSNIL